MRILPLHRFPRRAIHSLRYRHLKLNWEAKLTPKPRNIVLICKKPAYGLLRKVARRGIRSIARQAQAADHGTMTIARRAIKSSFTECVQQFHHYLAEQIDQSTHITQEQVLGRIAQRFPKYKSVISAIPVAAECIPEGLKQDLVIRAQSKSFRIALVLLHTWAKECCDPLPCWSQQNFPALTN
jgi:hypothetical protein